MPDHLQMSQTGTERGGIIKNPPSKEETEPYANFLIRKSKLSKPTADPQVLPVCAKHLNIYRIKMNKLEVFTADKFSTIDKAIHL